MSAPLHKNCLWQEAGISAHPAGRFLASASRRVLLRELDGKTFLQDDLAYFRGKSVMLQMASQLAAALALIELDGLVQRIILCPPDLSSVQLGGVVADTMPDLILTDIVERGGPLGLPISYCGIAPRSVIDRPARSFQSEWLLFTSGTTGRPKAVVHDLNSLVAPLREVREFAYAIWSTFYDIRRYGGLQILLRALLDGGSMIFSEAGETIPDFVLRAADSAVTHMSGTPSQWRRLLMSGAADRLRLDYVRLSGEVADQAILDALRIAFPAPRISHAFASTEAGVVFDVADGQAGFPADYVNNKDAPVELKIDYQTLRVRSARNAKKYLTDGLFLFDEAGFIDTGDIVELRDGRYYFVGRKEGLINVGGLKVHPEEVEAIVNLHPAVQMSLVRGRSSSITGALVVADIVIRQDHLDCGASAQAICDEIMAACRSALAAYKVPTQLRVVPSLALSASGKLLRAHV